MKLICTKRKESSCQIGAWIKSWKTEIHMTHLNSNFGGVTILFAMNGSEDYIKMAQVFRNSQVGISILLSYEFHYFTSS